MDSELLKEKTHIMTISVLITVATTKKVCNICCINVFPYLFLTMPQWRRCVDISERELVLEIFMPCFATIHPQTPTVSVSLSRNPIKSQDFRKGNGLLQPILMISEKL